MSDNYSLLVVDMCKLFGNNHCTSDEMFYEQSHYDCIKKRPFFFKPCSPVLLWNPFLESENAECSVLLLTWFILDEK